MRPDGIDIIELARLDASKTYNMLSKTDKPLLEYY